MAKITLNTTGVGIFKSLNKTEAKAQGQSHASNPFGISFKGNVIQADVFQTSAQETSSVKERGKMFMSAVVGNISAFNNSIKERLNSAVSFGRRVRDNVSTWWEQAKNTEISFDLSELSRFVSEKFNNNPYGVNNLLKRPANELEELFRAELAG